MSVEGHYVPVYRDGVAVQLIFVPEPLVVPEPTAQEQAATRRAKYKRVRGK